MANRIAGITVEINGDTTKLSKALEGVNKDIRSTQSQLKDVEKLLKLDPTNTELLTQKQKLLANEVASTKDKLQALKNANEQAARSASNYDAWKAAYDPIQAEIEETNTKLKELKTKAKEAQKQLSGGEISQEQYDAIQREITQTEEKLKDLKQSAKDVSDAFGHPISPEQYDALQREIIATEEELKSLERQAANSKTALEKIGAVGSKLQSAGDKISGVGQSLMPVTVALSGVGVAGLKVASDFDTAKAITGATGKDFEKLRNQAIDLGASTSFSSGEVAEAMTEMAKAGWSTQQILDGMGGVLDATAASGESLGSVATIVADAITGFGLSASDSAMVADLLTQAANAGTIGIADLGESFKYIAPIAQSMGLSISDTTTALSAMSMAGIKGSQAGTALRTCLANLVKPSDTVATAMQDLNLNITNSDGSFKSLDDIVGQMRTSFSGLTDDQKAYYATALGGKEGMSGLLALLNLTEEEYNAIGESMDNCSGVAQETATVMQDNLASKVEQLGGALESLAIRLADYLLPYLEKLVEKITDAVDAFTNLDPHTQKVILAIAGIVAALGPMLIIIGKVVSSVGTIMTVISKLPATLSAISGGISSFAGALGVSVGALGAIVAAIAVAVAAFVHLWNTNDEFKSRILGIWQQIKDTFTNLTQGITDRINALGFDFENFTEVLKAAWDALCNLLAPVFEGVFQNLANVFQEFAGILTGILDVIIGLFTGNWEQLWTGVKEIFTSVWNFIIATFQNIGNTLIGIADVILGWFGTSWNEV